MHVEPSCKGIFADLHAHAVADFPNTDELDSSDDDEPNEHNAALRCGREKALRAMKYEKRQQAADMQAARAKAFAGQEVARPKEAENMQPIQVTL